MGFGMGEGGRGGGMAGKDDGEEKEKARFFNVMGFHEAGRVNSFRSEGELPCWEKSMLTGWLGLEVGDEEHLRVSSP
jgi:hypothetical protein